MADDPLAIGRGTSALWASSSQAARDWPPQRRHCRTLRGCDRPVGLPFHPAAKRNSARRCLVSARAIGEHNHSTGAIQFYASIPSLAHAGCQNYRLCAGICNDDRFCWVFVEGGVRTVRRSRRAWCRVPQCLRALAGVSRKPATAQDSPPSSGGTAGQRGERSTGRPTARRRWMRPFAGRFSGTSTAPLGCQELPQPIIESETYASPRTVLRVLRGNSSLLGDANSRMM